MRQASRRSWRIGQRTPVEVTFLVYAQTLQADALGLIAAKVRSALTIEGELPEDGLAALEGDNNDIFLALARRLTERTGAEDQPLEEIFARVRRIETEADDYLVDADWDEKTMSTSVAGPGSPGPPNDITETWQSVVNRPPEAVPLSSQAQAVVPTAKIVTFDDLANLVQRPRARRNTVPSIN